MKTGLLVSCEHAGHFIPKEYQNHFKAFQDLLLTHRGWDPGALTLATIIADLTQVDLHFNTISRLLVESNRSPYHHELFSEVSSKFSNDEKSLILSNYYQPYQKEIEDAVNESLASYNRVIHLGIHSFTPVIRGQKRYADIGILFDDRRKEELKFAEFLKNYFSRKHPNWKVRFNYPYDGKDDGLVPRLRKSLPIKKYIGIEMEFNQKHVTLPIWREFATCTAEAVNEYNQSELALV